MSDASLDLIAQALGVTAPFLAVWLTLWWDARRTRRRRR